jgi:hypothetical protein
MSLLKERKREIEMLNERIKNLEETIKQLQMNNVNQKRKVFIFLKMEIMIFFNT